MYTDQHAALEWVQRNIHAFGGDPNKVTIFGEVRDPDTPLKLTTNMVQSAGAFSVDALLTAPVYIQNPPFRGRLSTQLKGLMHCILKLIRPRCHSSIWSILI
jgi:hypothetical protein